MNRLTHLDDQGNAQMVDVGGKEKTRRIAVAGGRIRMRPETVDLITAGKHKKGDVLGIARVAAIMGAKRTADLVPLCHPLSLTHVEIGLEVGTDTVTCTARVETVDHTGVEMEALTAVQIALLTIYDMCKSVDRGMVMENICLLEKSGGRSGTWKR